MRIYFEYDKGDPQADRARNVSMVISTRKRTITLAVCTLIRWDDDAFGGAGLKFLRRGVFGWYERDGHPGKFDWFVLWLRLRIET